MEIMRLAIDVESGDFGPQVIIAGILHARQMVHEPLKVYICGKRSAILQVVDSLDAYTQLGDFEIVDCCGVIQKEEQRATVWKRRTNASIVRCITLQKERVVDASISAGDTAILMGAALFILGRGQGVVRPALAAFLPTIKKKPALLLDVGANLNCRTEYLDSFAAMGSRYVSRFFGIQTPKVALLNIGKEAGKGTRIIAEAHQALQKSCEGYIGFVEGNDVLVGDADVVVCDGFCGNVLLKACESLHRLVGSVLEDKVKLSQMFKENMMVLDPENYGAVPFLGIQGTVLKAHGGSSSRAIANAILTAITAVKQNAVWETVRPKGNE